MKNRFAAMTEINAVIFHFLNVFGSIATRQPKVFFLVELVDEPFGRPRFVEQHQAAAEIFWKFLAAHEQFGDGQKDLMFWKRIFSNGFVPGRRNGGECGDAMRSVAGKTSNVDEKRDFLDEWRRLLGFAIC